jgi:hypothetical protein
LNNFRVRYIISQRNMRTRMCMAPPPGPVVRVCCLACLAWAAGCPKATNTPIAPGVQGIVDAAEGVDVSAGLTLEMRYYPANCAAPETRFPEDCDSMQGYEEMSFPVDSLRLPREFEFGPEGVGATGQQNWYVLAWIAGTENNRQPLPGEYYGLAEVTLYDCSNQCRVTCYCGRVYGLPVTIDTLVE